MAEPLTQEEYAAWKGNIEAIAKAQAEGWYKRKGDGLVRVQGFPTGDITTTVKIQLRLFATIDALQRQLQQAQETLSHTNEAYESVKAERDAAIERAEDAEAWMNMVKNASDFPKELLERAEAAERELEEQRALAARVIALTDGIAVYSHDHDLFALLSQYDPLWKPLMQELVRLESVRVTQAEVDAPAEAQEEGNA